MVVFDLEAAPQKLRGILSRWCLEVRAGLFVGRLDGRMRDLLWEKVADLATPNMTAVMIWREPTEQGYAFQTLGAGRREPVQVDGMWLVVVQPEPDRRGTSTGASSGATGEG